MRDFAQVKGDGVVTQQIADAALNMLNVDKEGFDNMDRRLMAAIVEQFAGGPVGLDAVAAAISEEKGTIEDVIEPYLIQQDIWFVHPVAEWRHQVLFALGT